MSPTYLFLDANFLLIPPQFQVDIYSEFERLIPKPWKIVMISAIFTELERKIAQFPTKTKLKREYSMARQLLDRQEYQLIVKKRSTNQIVDDLLLETALDFKKQGGDIYLCTNDKELREKCNRNSMTAVYLRQRKFLDID